MHQGEYPTKQQGDRQHNKQVARVDSCRMFGTFLFLYFMDGTMQRVSLASFVLAMGMLVDNAIVIIDGILVDLKAGKSRMEAMTAIGRQTAMPLLGATLIAIIAFLPIFMSPDTAGVYTRDLFKSRILSDSG